MIVNLSLKVVGCSITSSYDELSKMACEVPARYNESLTRVNVSFNPLVVSSSSMLPLYDLTSRTKEYFHYQHLAYTVSARTT